MNRLPSRQTLAAMSAENRWSPLDAFAREVRDEIDAFDCDLVVSVGGTPVATYLRYARRKLKRVYAAADHFGDYVGQPA